MENKETHEENECRKKIKQQITIPFQWEEAPGAPKRDWKPECHYKPVNHVPLPVKYIASIPFKWEEKPGTPLRTFARDPTKHQTEDMEPENKNLPLPPGYFSKYADESEGDSSYDDDYDDQDWISELDLETMSVESEESFCSAPSVLANQVKPLRNPYVEEKCNWYGSDLFEGPFEEESSGSAVNYGAGNASLKGAEFLAQLFPLYPVKSGFLNQGKNPVEKSDVSERKLNFLEVHKKVAGNGRRSGVIRRPCTLEELIMQSRRRSYRRKAINMRKLNEQKNFTKNEPQGCFNIVASGSGLAKMLRKDFLALNFS